MKHVIRIFCKNYDILRCSNC